MSQALLRRIDRVLGVGRVTDGPELLLEEKFRSRFLNLMNEQTWYFEMHDEFSGRLQVGFVLIEFDTHSAPSETYTATIMDNEFQSTKIRDTVFEQFMDAVTKDTDFSLALNAQIWAKKKLDDVLRPLGYDGLVSVQDQFQFSGDFNFNEWQCFLHTGDLLQRSIGPDRRPIYRMPDNRFVAGWYHSLDAMAADLLRCLVHSLILDTGFPAAWVCLRRFVVEDNKEWSCFVALRTRLFVMKICRYSYAGGIFAIDTVLGHDHSKIFAFPTRQTSIDEIRQILVELSGEQASDSD